MQLLIFSLLAKGCPYGLTNFTSQIFSFLLASCKSSHQNVQTSFKIKFFIWEFHISIFTFRSEKNAPPAQMRGLRLVLESPSITLEAPEKYPFRSSTSQKRTTYENERAKTSLWATEYYLKPAVNCQPSYRGRALSTEPPRA